MRTFIGILVGFFLCCPFLGWGAVRIIDDIRFDRNVEGHLKRAGDANTVELAEKELAGVVEYLEKNQMTTGYTSIFWETPDEDVGFWFQNLQASLGELQAVPPEATQMERSNILIKLRETLVDHGQNTTVTVPAGITIFPYNVSFCWWGILSGILAAIGVFAGWWIIETN